MQKMPILPVEAMVNGLTDWEAGIVRKAFTGNKLRASKPFSKVQSFEDGCANYVWRMLCFDLAGFGKHACMPICADFEVYQAFTAKYGKSDWENLDVRGENVRAMMKILDVLVSRVEKCLPITAMKGIVRWGRALGMIQ